MDAHREVPPATHDPFPASLQRAGALAGTLIVILMIASIAPSGDDTPDFNAPAGEWTTFAQDNEEDLRRSALVMLVGVYTFLWFLGYLRGAIGAAESVARGFTRVSHVEESPALRRLCPQPASPLRAWTCFRGGSASSGCSTRCSSCSFSACWRRTWSRDIRNL